VGGKSTPIYGKEVVGGKGGHHVKRIDLTALAEVGYHHTSFRNINIYTITDPASKKRGCLPE